MAVLRFDQRSGEAYLSSTHPGIDDADVSAKTGWTLHKDAVRETPPPTDLELRIIRDCDPTGFWLN
jgi:glutaconate CoA-transferase subunit B